MPVLQPVGRVENPGDIEPPTIPIVGYTTKGNKEVITEITFRPEFPAGKFLELMRSADALGQIHQEEILDYLDACVIKEDREAWKKLLYSDEINVAQTTVVAVYHALAEYYAGINRPSKQRSGSSGGPKPSKRTTEGAAPAKASRAKPSR